LTEFACSWSKLNVLKLLKDFREFMAQLVSLWKKKIEKLALPPANYSKQQKEISQEYNELCSSRQERDRLNGDWGEE